MKKVLVFGNSGAGKSTLSKKLASNENLAHLDLDVLAFKKDPPTERRDIDASMLEINVFLAKHDAWVIEGGYADLLERLLDHANEMVFLDLSAESCQENAKNREWEPHKYESKAAQDKNLEMLLNWILDYYQREDSFSQVAHQGLFKKYSGNKTRITSNE